MTNQEQILLCASWCLFLLLVLPWHPKAMLVILGTYTAYKEWRLERAYAKWIKLTKHKYIPFGEV
jgi:flagellar biosynthesis component FlhA